MKEGGEASKKSLIRGKLPAGGSREMIHEEKKEKKQFFRIFPP